MAVRELSKAAHAEISDAEKHSRGEGRRMTSMKKALSHSTKKALLYWTWLLTFVLALVLGGGIINHFAPHYDIWRILTALCVISPIVLGYIVLLGRLPE